ncbi:serine/threonine protein kinase [Thermoleophilia bacterium SCSIO 60948]|nr:serine/threonine protein kinase [Thermoleophilia bacterium SCSIO 60948]
MIAVAGLRSLARRARHRDGPPPAGHGEELLPGCVCISHLRRGNELDVFDAWSAVRSSRVVVKTARPDRLGDERTVRQLAAEGALLSRLSHPHIGRCYEVSSDPPALVLETLAGQTLAALLDENDPEPMADADVGQLGLQLASALDYLHREGVVHLDVKPSNLIAESGRIRLIDMNLARPPGRVSPGYGTDGYMSPEQEDGGEVGPPADVYGLALVLAECSGGDPDSRDPLAGASAAVSAALAGALAADPSPRPTLGDLMRRFEALAGVPAAERLWSDPRFSRPSGGSGGGR